MTQNNERLIEELIAHGKKCNNYRFVESLERYVELFKQREDKGDNRTES